MKKTPRSKISAMTLTELLIASALIGVVITGALSADFAIRTWQKRIEQRTMVQMDLAMAMEQIKKDAMATIGSKTCAFPDGGCSWLGNTGIISFPVSWIAFRQNPQIGTDPYYIFYYQTPPSANYVILRFKYLPTTGAEEEWGNLVDSGDILFKPITAPFSPFFQLEYDAEGRVTAIEIRLTSRPDPTKAEHPLTNPTYSLTTRVLPPGLSQ